MNRKQIAIKYLKSWFIVDLISSVPVNLILLGQLNNTTVSFQLIKLLKAFTLYRLLTLGKYLKLTRNNKVFEWIQSKVSISRDATELQTNLLRMLILVHFIGCAWAIIGTINVTDERSNWLRNSDNESKSGLVRYATSCYWAVVTICTVGYGEIYPTNSLEVATNIIAVWFGVSFQSYIMSRVTMIFNSTKPLEFQIERAKKVEEFC